jgi:antitoxin YobK
MADYERAADLIERHADGADFAGPRPPELIEAAEQALGFRFPPSYRRFLAEYGAGGFGGTEVYGVVDADFESSSIPDGVWYNLTLRREGFDETLYAFYDVGDGETFCLDTTRAAADGEVPVVAVRFGGDDDREEIAPDFGSAFLTLVEEELGLAGR